MVSKNNPYTAPGSDVSNQKSDLVARFCTLGVWRILCIVLMWFVILFIGVGGVFGFVSAMKTKTIGIGLWQMVFILIIIALSIWTHLAIVRRSITQMKIIAILNVILLFNIMGALLMLSILRVTKKEHEKYNVISIQEWEGNTR